MLLKVFMIASARTVSWPPRTAWVWLPVQKNARARPRQTIAPRNAGTAVEATSRPYVAASSSAAPTISQRSGMRARNHVTCARPKSWTTPEAAVKNPTLAAS
jgi:hypothetical protein